MGEVIAPQGHIVLIVEQVGTLDLGGPYKLKSVSVSWELMFTRSLFTTADIQHQHDILNRVAELIDAGKIKCTANDSLSPHHRRYRGQRRNSANMDDTDRHVAAQHPAHLLGRPRATFRGMPGR